MAQVTDSLAQAILNGAGFTRNEVEQLCYRWLVTRDSDRIPELERQNAELVAKLQAITTAWQNGSTLDVQAAMYWAQDRVLANTATSANAGGLSNAECHTLRRVIECAEILDKRPRPMCRDCADKNGTCPNSGLECDMRKLFAAAKALHNKLAQPTATATPHQQSDEKGIG